MGLQTDLARAGSGIEAWQRLSKIAFFAIGAAYLPLLAFRYLLFPDFGLGPSQSIFILAASSIVILGIGFLRVSKAGIFWMYLICILALLGVAGSALGGGAPTLWPLPSFAALFSLLIAYPVVSTSDKSREVWGLTLRQRGLAA
ncbi:hypothetical protein, partial [Altererythrobacter litoralis]|nr:hypothetical protein [Erythrobacteraceae bacterium 1XM1-14]